jgi:hypothetical protein
LPWLERVYTDIGISNRIIDHKTIRVIETLPSEYDDLAQILGYATFGGEVWREAGTFVECFYGDTEYGHSIALKLWEISKSYLAKGRDRQYAPEKQPVSQTAKFIADLNIARAKLRYPMSSEDHKTGEELLLELKSNRKVPWRYYRHLKELDNNPADFC